jgi:transcriptional regulator with XRE-family HTH domain
MQKSIHSTSSDCLRKILKAARVQAGLTQQSLAGRLGVAQSFVSKYESGERRLDIVELRDVCRAIGISFSSVIRRFEEAQS